MRRKRTKAPTVEDYILFHSAETQEQIRQSEEDIKAGRYVQFKASEIDKLLKWLHEGEEVNGDERES